VIPINKKTCKTKKM